MLVTGYDNSFQSTGKRPGDKGYGQTASGSMAAHGTIAAPQNYPFGTRTFVPGYGLGTVKDRGGAINGSHIDVWFPTTKEAIHWGAPTQNGHRLQMRIMNIIAQSLLVVLVSASASVAAATNHATFTATLGYPPGSRAPATSLAFHSPHGQAYRFRLDRQRDVGGNDIVVELVMQGASSSSVGSNLLDPTGRLHGMQKWFFAASDLAHGPERSVYGNPRTIDLPKLGITVEANVVRVGVKPTPATPGMPAGYRFTDLTLEVRVRRG